VAKHLRVSELWKSGLRRRQRCLRPYAAWISTLDFGHFESAGGWELPDDR